MFDLDGSMGMAPLFRTSALLRRSSQREGVLVSLALFMLVQTIVRPCCTVHACMCSRDIECWCHRNDLSTKQSGKEALSKPRSAQAR